jgi:purine-binding chemotaxis protein CheW
MNSPAGPEVLEELRRAFDQTFAAPAVRPADNLTTLITIRVAGQAFALHAKEITALAKRSRIVPVPSRVPELLGLAGVRGALVPVYDLAALLGLPRRAGEPQWFVLAHREAQLALAVDEIEGLAEIPKTDLFNDDASPSRDHVRQLARIGTGTRALIDIPAIVETIRQHAGSSEPARE